MAEGDCQEAEYEGVDADSPLTSSPHKTAPAVPQEETEYEGIESLPTSSPIQAPAPSTSPGATNHDSDPQLSASTAGWLAGSSCSLGPG